MRLSRRNAIIGLGALVGGAGIVGGTGAFSTVQAERGFDVSTAGDSGALLGLEPLDTPNGNEYASSDGNTLTIDISGINLNAITHLHRVFEITNNGSQPVTLYLQEEGEYTAAVDAGVRADQLVDPDTSEPNPGPSGDGIADLFGDTLLDVSNPGEPGYSDIGVRLGVGTSLELGIYVDTSDSNVNDGLDGEEGGSGEITEADAKLIDRMIVWAEADADYEYEAASN